MSKFDFCKIRKYPWIRGGNSIISYPICFRHFRLLLYVANSAILTIKNILMKSIIHVVLFPLFVCCNLPLFGQQGTLMGFSEKSASVQRATEQEFDKMLNPNNLDQWMKYMSAKPHHVGSPYDKKVVDFIISALCQYC